MPQNLQELVPRSSEVVRLVGLLTRGELALPRSVLRIVFGLHLLFGHKTKGCNSSPPASQCSLHQSPSLFALSYQIQDICLSPPVHRLRQLHDTIQLGLMSPCICLAGSYQAKGWLSAGSSRPQRHRPSCYTPTEMYQTSKYLGVKRPTTFEGLSMVTPQMKRQKVMKKAVLFKINLLWPASQLMLFL